jgi:DNA-binding XRE family transcriptional regulator
MSRRISEKTKQLIRKLHNEGLSIPEIARRASVSRPSVWGYSKAIERGFTSYHSYQKYLTEQRGFTSYHSYQKYLTEQRGFTSYHSYQKYLTEQRQKKSFNKELSNLIIKNLKRLEKNQSWLAKQIGVSREAVSKYTKGKYTPNKEILNKLCSTLKVQYQTLENLLKDINY